MAFVRPKIDRRRTLVVAAIVVLAVVIATPFALRLGRQYAPPVMSRLALGARPMNILLIANNARNVAATDPLGLGTAAGQADVIILARVDPAAHVVYAITIPRDALVGQPSFHNTVPKIKTLFFMGDQENPPKGPQYLAKAVSQMTGLPVDGYIAANFAGFTDAVDLVGGLTIDVKARVYDPQNSGADFEPGVQHMDGAQALAFIRVRQNRAGNGYRVNDYQRAQAEVDVLGLLRNKILDPAHAAGVVPRFVSHMKRDVATNLSDEQLVRLGIAMSGAPVYQVAIGSIADSMVLAPVSLAGIDKEGRIDGAEYDVLDPGQIRQQLAQFGARATTTGLPALPKPQTLRVRLYGTPHMLLHLQHLGFTRVTLVGGATGANEVIFPPAHPEWGWAAARALGEGNTYVTPGNTDVVVIRE